MIDSSTYVFATGMFRSGTTLLARLLNSCDNVAFASDPFLPIFKSCRNAIAEKLHGRVDQDAPFDDYYFSSKERIIFDNIYFEENELPLRSAENFELKRKITESVIPYSPKIVNHIDDLKLNNLKSAIQSGMAIIKQAYGNKSSLVVGFKEVWVGEFCRFLLSAFPNMRVIYMIRDPRGVCASKQVQPYKYPLSFLCRQWRKLATIAWKLDQEKEIRDRFLLIRYEDLICQPESTIIKICNFLNIEFSEHMLDPSNFKNDYGAPWLQNTSYSGNISSKFNKSSVDKWKTFLSSKEIEYIELSCYFEMTLFGYDSSIFAPNAANPDLFLNPPVVKRSELANWIRKYSKKSCEDERVDMALDYARHFAIFYNQAKNIEQKRKLTLFSELYDFITNKREVF